MDTFGTACDTNNEAGLCFEGCLICSIFPLRVMRQHRFATSTQCSLTQPLIFFPGTEEFSVLPVFPGSSGNVLVSDSMKSWWIKTTNDAVSIVSSPWKFGECLHCILQWDALWTMNLMVIRSSIGRHDTAKKKVRVRRGLACCGKKGMKHLSSDFKLTPTYCLFKFFFLVDLKKNPQLHRDVNKLWHKESLFF